MKRAAILGTKEVQIRQKKKFFLSLGSWELYLKIKKNELSCPSSSKRGKVLLREGVGFQDPVDSQLLIALSRILELLALNSKM